MEIKNTKVYGLEESVIASHYPMSTADFLAYDIPAEKDWERARKLGRAPIGSGHDNYLKGIIVQADWRAPNYMWPQIQRYHFLDIVSSQSKMHSLPRMDMETQCNKYVLPETIGLVKKLTEEFNKNPTKKNFNKLLSNTPQGIYLTARITTNYLQLKTMFSQRKNHRLEDWSKDFVDWCYSLPHFIELTQKPVNEKTGKKEAE